VTSKTAQKHITIINYDIISDWSPLLRQSSFDLVIADECFIAGTKIKTPKKDKDIEDIKIGDKVFNANGIGIVKNIGKKKANSLVKLHLSNNKIITCTPEHPFFTEDGWVFAKNLKNKKLFNSFHIFNIMDKSINLKIKEGKNEKIKILLQRMQKTFCKKDTQSNILLSKMLQYLAQKTSKNKKRNLRVVQKTHQFNPLQKTILRNILLREMENVPPRNKSKTIYPKSCKKNQHKNETSTSRQSTMGSGSLQKNEKKQPHQKSKNSSKNQSNLEEKRTSVIQTTNKRRQWKTHAQTTCSLIHFIREKLESGISNKNISKSREWFSYLLQSRFSIAQQKNMDRSRWMGAPNSGRNKKRPEKNKISENIRVERVEIYQRRSNGQSKKSNKQNTTVYNLEVSGHPSYFAEGVLVHNCHYLKNRNAKRTKAVIELGKKFKQFIGLSGTPIINRPIEFFNALNLMPEDIVPPNIPNLDGILVDHPIRMNCMKLFQK